MTHHFETIRRVETNRRVVHENGYFCWEYTNKVKYVSLDEAVQELSQSYFEQMDEYSTVEYSAQNGGPRVPAMFDLWDRALVHAIAIRDEGRFEHLDMF